MKLASFEVGPDRPFFLIAGPCVIESEALVHRCGGTPEGNDRQARDPVHLQGLVRQGQSFLARKLPRTRHGCAA